MHCQIGNKVYGKDRENDKNCQRLYFHSAHGVWKTQWATDQSQLSYTVFSRFTHHLIVLFKKIHDQFDCFKHQLCLWTTHLISPSSDCLIPSVDCFYSPPLQPCLILYLEQTWRSVLTYLEFLPVSATVGIFSAISCQLNLLPDSPHLLPQIWDLLWIWKFWNWFALLSLSSWMDWVGCWFKCIQKEKENFSPLTPPPDILQVRFCRLCAPGHYF